MEIMGKISEIPEIIQTFAKRSKNVFPPIVKNCVYQLLVNKITWVLVALLLLPCILGMIIYYQTDDQRQFQESNGEKIYVDSEGRPTHEDNRETFLDISDAFVISFVAIIMAIIFSSELINEEFENKTMQLLRTTPIHPFEILLYRYVSGVICMFGILGLNAILFYYTTMMPSGTHGIIENLDILLMVLQVLFFESLAFIAIFCVFTAYLEKPYLVGILYWIIWESFVSGQNYQKLTITHYLNSILFDSTKAMGWDVAASDYNLINSKEEIIATEPLTAMIVILTVAVVALIIGSRGLANRQF